MDSDRHAVRESSLAPHVQGTGAASRLRQVSHPVVTHERELVERMRGGDVGAYETVFRSLVPRLCDYAFRYVESRDEAEDVVQTVFAKVWDNRKELRIHGTLTQFLYLAVRNLAIDRLRRTTLERRWNDRVTRGDIEGPGPRALSDPEADLERAERHAAIELALSELPARRRRVCVLRWQEGLPYAEIADRLGIAEQTVKNQLARAVEGVSERIREILG